MVGFCTTTPLHTKQIDLDTGGEAGGTTGEVRDLGFTWKMRSGSSKDIPREQING